MSRRNDEEDERAKVRAARAALAQEIEIEALHDAELHEKIKAGEIPHPDSNADDFIEDDEDEDDDEDDKDEDQEDDDEDDEAPTPDLRERDGDGDAHADGPQSQSPEGSGEDAPEASGVREGDGGEAGLADAQRQWSLNELEQLTPDQLREVHLTVVGRYPHDKTGANKQKSNILTAQIKKG